MNRLLTRPLLLSVLALSTFARAEVLTMPAPADADSATEEGTWVEVPVTPPVFTKPRKGASMKEVVRLLGEPKVKHKAAGGGSRRNPPITRWDYDGFSVFFEYTHVVDTVVQGYPAQLYNADQLKPKG